jgi:hypothetical protein
MWRGEPQMWIVHAYVLLVLSVLIQRCVVGSLLLGSDLCVFVCWRGFSSCCGFLFLLAALSVGVANSKLTQKRRGKLPSQVDGGLPSLPCTREERRKKGIINVTRTDNQPRKVAETKKKRSKSKRSKHDKVSRRLAWSRDAHSWSRVRNTWCVYHTSWLSWWLTGPSRTFPAAKRLQ